MRSALARIVLLSFVVVDAVPAATGCGEDCTEARVPVQVSVDGRAPGTCASWVLEVRACSTGGSCQGGCGACVDGAPDPPVGDSAASPECEPIDACDHNELRLTPGDYRVCVHAELVNGGISFDSCADASVPAEGDAGPVPIAVDTDDAFPCIRDWTFNGSSCCNAMFGCVPPGS